jgi:hypothetical protein
MPSDLLNIKKIYPDSKIAFKFYHYVENIIKNTEHMVPIVNTPNLADWFQFAEDESEMDELKVIAVGSEYFSKGTTENLNMVRQRKFMGSRNDYKNVEATWYLKYTSGTDPWCIYARSSARRTSKKPCVGSCYCGYLSPSGQVRLAKEIYFGNKTFASDWKQAITGLVQDQIVGMKFICYNIENDTAVCVELWIDELNTNDWKLEDTFTDMGNNWGQGAGKCGCSNDREAITWGGPVVGFMCEGSSPSNTNYSFSKLTVREINPGGQFTEAKAGHATAVAGGGKAFASTSGQSLGADTGGGVGDGLRGTAAPTDTEIGTGDNNRTDPNFTVRYDGSTTTGQPFPFPAVPGTSGTSSAPISSPSTATSEVPTTGSNQAPEKPLVTLYKDLGVMYNIVLDSSSACDAGNPFVIDYRQIYQASGVDTQEIKMYAKTGGTIRAGIKARSSIAIMVNKIIRKVTVSLRKFGNPTTGTLGMEIRDINGNLEYTFPTTIDPATVATGGFGPTYTFTADANNHKCQTGDMLLLTYANAGADADSNNCIILKSTDKDEIDGFDSSLITQTFGSTTYTTDQEKDFIATIFI